MSSGNSIKKKKNILIGERLKKVRISLNKGNQDQFATELGINQATLSKYEKGTSETPDEIKIILGRYGINLHWLISGEGEMFLSSQEKALAKTPNPGALIDQRLEKLEARMTEIESRLNKTSKKPPGFGMYTHDPEPEYAAEETCQILFVNKIAAGPPIPQSEDRSEYINVPKSLIKGKPEDHYAARVQGDSMIKKIPNDSIVLIKRSDKPKHNRIQVVRQGNSSTLKRLKEHEGNRWTLEYENDSGKHIEPGPGDEIQGDFVDILPEGK